MRTGSILNPLAGNFSEDTGKKGKGAKTGTGYSLASEWNPGMKPIIHTTNLWRQILPIGKN